MNAAAGRHAGRRWRSMFWIALLALATATLARVRADLDDTHAVLVYLLIVLGASASAGRFTGLTLAVASAAIIDYAFQRPFDTFAVGHRLDVIVLAAFIATAFVATDLLTRAQAAAARAIAHAETVARVSAERDAFATAAREAEALRAVAAAKDAMLAAVSHDLRTPVAAIQLLSRERHASADATLQAIGEQAAALEHLVTQVLDYARLRGGATAIDVEPFSVEDLVGIVIRRFKPVGAARGSLAHHLALDAPPVWVACDGEQTVRALGNLVDNALRHAGTAPHVELSVTAEPDRACIVVADRGPGLPAGMEPLSGEPYEGASGRRGLGLAIARQLITLQGGTLGYHPRAGGGSEFQVWLPRVVGPPSNAD